MRGVYTILESMHGDSVADARESSRVASSRVESHESIASLSSAIPTAGLDWTGADWMRHRIASDASPPTRRLCTAHRSPHIV
jgi:hypothetical protein